MGTAETPFQVTVFRGLAANTYTEIYVGAHVINPHTEERGQIQEIYDDGTVLLERDSGETVRIKLRPA